MHIPVNGLGAHRIACSAFNNAHDPNGDPGQSPPATFTMTIRHPTVAGLWFPTVKNPIRCSTRRERVRIPGKWVTVFRHHRPVWVQRPARTVVRRVTHCRARVVTRKTVSWTAGQTPRQQALGQARALPPCRAAAAAGRLRGATRTLRTRIAGRRLAGHDRAGAARRTAGRCCWRLPRTARGPSVRSPPRPRERTGPGPRCSRPGPRGSSRRSTSARAPPSPPLPTRRAWRFPPGSGSRSGPGVRTGAAGSESGDGSWAAMCPASGELVVLYIGWRGGFTEIGHLYTDKRGRFSAPYRFLRGNGTERYWIWAASAKESDYPYAPGALGPDPHHRQPARMMSRQGPVRAHRPSMGAPWFDQAVQGLFSAE